MPAGLLFDSVKCIACGACSEGCKEANRLPGGVEAKTTAYTWTTVEKKEAGPIRRLCMHCLEPACVSVCPVAALEKTPEGPVTYDGEKCMGCRYCMMACPFDVPKYQWDRPLPIIGKCILCADRIKKGGATACSEACPVEATVFGQREDLLKLARERMAAEPAKYTGGVYGFREVGGTSVLMIASAPFGRLGLRTDLSMEPPSSRTWQVLSRVPDFVAVWGVFLYGIHWITARRDTVAKEERS